MSRQCWARENVKRGVLQITIMIAMALMLTACFPELALPRYNSSRTLKMYDGPPLSLNKICIAQPDWPVKITRVNDQRVDVGRDDRVFKPPYPDTSSNYILELLPGSYAIDLNFRDSGPSFIRSSKGDLTTDLKCEAGHVYLIDYVVGDVTRRPFVRDITDHRDAQRYIKQVREDALRK
jgi:hypothetical protein